MLSLPETINRAARAVCRVKSLKSIQFNAKLLPSLHPLFLLQGLPLLPPCLLLLHGIRSSGDRRSGRLACGHADSLCGPQGQERGQSHSPAGNSTCRWNATAHTSNNKAPNLILVSKLRKCSKPKSRKGE